MVSRQAPKRQQPRSKTTAQPVAPANAYQIGIVGAGFAGIAAAIKLKQAGFHDFVIFEKASELGGVWRENTYPGCACDVPSAFYSYSFAPNPKWSRVFAGHREIKTYLHQVAADHDVLTHIHYNTEVLNSAWENTQQHWQITTNHGSYQLQFLITAGGPLHEPVIPKIAGQALFQGTQFHSSQWRHDIDLTGKRVAVIGSGASAIQFVPAIVPHVSQLYLFQRTPQWILPKLDLPIPQATRTLFTRFPSVQKGLRTGIYGVFELINTSFRYPQFSPFMQRLALLNLKQHVKDPELYAKLLPNFKIGCKRVLQSANWYPALTQVHVTVIPSGVTEINTNGVIDESGQTHSVDVIIYGTGFATTEPEATKHLFNGEGISLYHTWQGTPRGYLGTVVHGFPNLLMMIGPNVAIGSTSALVIIEAQLNFIIDLLRKMRQQRLRQFDVKQSVQDAFNEKVQRALTHTVWNAGGCTSYYLDRNGINSAMWPWSSLQLRHALRHSNLADFNLR